MIKSLFIKIPALVLIGITYLLASPKKLAPTEREALASQFAFQKITLASTEGEKKMIRNVHPQYEHIAAWISSVGAAVTIDDLDGDGLNNDIAYVDTRVDKVILVHYDDLTNHKITTTLDVKALPYDPATMAPMGTRTYDFNQDGRVDILAYYWGRTPVLFLKDSTGYKEVELVNNGERWFSNTVTLADFDGDRQVDILVTNYFPDGSRVLDQHATDDDQTMQHTMSRAANGGKNHFFLYSGMKDDAPVFREDKGWSQGIKNPEDWTLGVAAVDFTGDMLPEIYLANDFGPDKFLLNQSSPGKLRFKALHGSRHLTTIASNVMGKDSYKGMGAGVGDINNDGLLDLYVSNIAAEYALEESHFAFINTGEIEKYQQGIAPFVNKSEELGLSRSSWGWDSKLGDFNNDGVLEAVQAIGFMKGETDRWPELQELALSNDNLLAHPAAWPHFRLGDDLSGHSHNPFFVKGSAGKFYDLAPELGIGEPQISRGIAIGDIDYDGDLDFFTANQWGDSYYFQNNYKGKNNFVGLRLLQPVNALHNPHVRPAIGATVQLYEKGVLTQTSYVDGGNGHSGSNSKDVFFGLKDLSTTDVYCQISYLGPNREKKTLKVTLDKGWNTIILPNNN